MSHICQPPSWPELLEQSRLDDSATQEAYDSVAAPLRQALKNGIAAAWQHFGPQGRTCAASISDPSLGFCEHSLETPADWALIVAGPAFDAPARLAAACALPRLAGVGLTAAAFPGGRPAPGLLLALAMSGCEDVFCPPAQGMRDAAEALCARGNGAMFLLHDGSLDDLAAHARSLGIALLEERSDPVLRVASPELFDAGTLVFCQGDAARRALAAGDAPDCYALYTGFPLAPGGKSPPLTLGPGLEGFWLHRQATPGFFRMARRSFSMTEGEPPFTDAGPDGLQGNFS